MDVFVSSRMHMHNLILCMHIIILSFMCRNDMNFSSSVVVTLTPYFTAPLPV